MNASGKTRPLVVFAEDWGGLPSSTQHLVAHLARTRRIIWVNSIGLRKPKLSLRDLRRLAQKAFRVLSTKRRGATPPQGDLIVIEPMAVPAPKTVIGRRLNRVILGLQVRRALRVAGLSKPILWMSIPTAEVVAGHVGESAVVYYCGDDFSALAGVDHEIAQSSERRLVEKAALIVAASHELSTRFPAERTYLLTHGADLRLFGQPAARAPDLGETGRIAGFYGSISDWIEIELLAAVARMLPDWTFVLIGNVATDVSPLQALRNVRFLGARDHAALPGYVQHWSVSLLPFRDNAQIRACNPLKLREYMAAGTPIVATEFPALDGFRDLIEVSVREPETFALAIEHAARDLKRNPQRVERVASQDWQAKAGQLAVRLDAL